MDLRASRSFFLRSCEEPRRRHKPSVRTADWKAESGKQEAGGGRRCSVHHSGGVVLLDAEEHRAHLSLKNNISEVEESARGHSQIHSEQRERREKRNGD